MRVRALLALALCATLSACGSSTAPTPSGPTPQQRMASILANARAQRSVHYSTQANFGFTVTADVARDRGSARFTEQNGKSVSLLDVRLVGNVAYIRGNDGGLEHIALLNGPSDARFAGRWIAIPSGNPHFRPVTEGLTLASLVRSIAPQTRGKLIYRPSAIQPALSHQFGGTKVIEIGRSTQTQGQIIDVRPSGNLPLAAAYSGTGIKTWWLMTRWNEPVSVTAPRNALPIAAVTGG